MHKIEQIAMKTGDIEHRIQTIGDVYDRGPVTVMKFETKWVRDTVRAKHVFVSPLYMLPSQLGMEFGVHLAFNYDIIPTRELELIQLDFGQTVQMVRDERLGLAHLGYHIPDGGDLRHEVYDWNKRGFRCAQISMTLAHSGTPRRYLYAFIDTLDQIGTYTKVIARRTDVHDKTYDDFVQEFSRVNP